ncbi:hypothetical protein ACIO93_34750 [Streptomyces sp. NPDC087903]|uniref:hypothetical protein n=1 Tax=Streptomyces sp. NPDC087903 TaxID=3365819 RepID=UPI003800CA00
MVDALGRRILSGLDDAHVRSVRVGLTYVLELRWGEASALRRGLAMLVADGARRGTAQNAALEDHKWCALGQPRSAVRPYSRHRLFPHGA